MLLELKELFGNSANISLDQNTFEAIHLDSERQGWVFRVRMKDERIFICHLLILDGVDRRQIDFFFTRSKCNNALTLFRILFPSWDKDDPDRFYVSWLQAIPTTLIHVFDKCEASVYRDIIEDIMDRDEVGTLFEYLLRCVLSVSLKYDLRVETDEKSIVFFEETRGSLFPGLTIEFDPHENGILPKVFACTFNKDKAILSRATIPGFDKLITNMAEAQLFSLWIEATILSIDFWLNECVDDQNDLFTCFQRKMETGEWMTQDCLSAQSLYFEIDSLLSGRK